MTLINALINLRVNHMERTMTATNARVHFGQVLRWVSETRQPIIVERAGRPQVVIMSVQEYERLKQEHQPERWKSLVEATHRLIQAELGDESLPAPDEVIRAMREERNGRLLDLR